jgi:preprotein translocase subunit SecE
MRRPESRRPLGRAVDDFFLVMILWAVMMAAIFFGIDWLMRDR